MNGEEISLQMVSPFNLSKASLSYFWQVGKKKLRSLLLSVLFPIFIISRINKGSFNNDNNFFKNWS